MANIRDLGVREIGIIVGEWGPQIAAVLGDGSRLGCEITYIRQDQPLGLAHCVSRSRRSRPAATRATCSGTACPSCRPRREAE